MFQKKSPLELKLEKLSTSQLQLILERGEQARQALYDSVGAKTESEKAGAELACTDPKVRQRLSEADIAYAIIVDRRDSQ